MYLLIHSAYVYKAKRPLGRKAGVARRGADFDKSMENGFFIHLHEFCSGHRII